MNSRRAILACVALLLCGCQPSVLCDPGQYHMGGGCYATPKDSGSDEEKDAGEQLDAAADGGGNECPGDPYDGFGVKCTAVSQCTCHAPDCPAAPLGYCTKYNCDTSDKAACPPDWTCLMIPAGASPDPSLKSLCLKM